MSTGGEQVRSSLCTSAVLWECPFRLNGKVVWEGSDQSVLLGAPPVACARGEGEASGSVGTPVVRK